MALGYAGKAAAFQAPSVASETDGPASIRQLERPYLCLMVNTQLLRLQHDDAIAMADRLLDLVDSYDPRKPVHPILLQLNRLVGLLRVHLAYEDVELYPRLVGSVDPHAARTAQGFVKEMGGLAVDLECFARHWSCSASICSNFAEFSDGLHELMLALAVRIERENQYLYPLIETGSEERRDAA